MVLRASAVTQENLERKIGVQLDEAALEDVLIPNMGNSAETLYDIDSFQRILDHCINNDDTSGKSHTLEGDSGNANMVMNETMKERVYELEKECTSMKQDLDKLVKTKEGRSFFSKLFGLRSKTKTSPGDEDGVRKE
ncbi:hypothetical protein Bca52824_095880 [Brassica carinata]|uniref:NPH3 domain-containing protein n=1 Tax=Brassica carinata TaxID=52824 RepID=A0A8X7THV6_BRACI|nr:hypothetical protein Bca52824_095880 [Brassica carinata]